MKVIIIGANGQLGRDVQKAFKEHEVICAGKGGCDYTLYIQHKKDVFDFLDKFQPELVINCAAMHDMNECEEHPDAAFEINAVGVAYLAQACEEFDARLMHISTDYVFGHGHQSPITEDTLPEPLSVYGASKLAGEHIISARCPNHIIVRTSSLYGHNPCRGKGGKNFVQTMLAKAEQGEPITVVDDVYMSPTFTEHLAGHLPLLAEARGGIYHVTNQGFCSWYDFACEIFHQADIEADIEPTASEMGNRPKYSVLKNQNADESGIPPMPTWQEGIATYFSSVPATP